MKVAKSSKRYHRSSARHSLPDQRLRKLTQSAADIDLTTGQKVDALR
jgi:hypothetical protein